MYKKLIMATSLLLSTKLCALSCSAPVTISDPKLHSSHSHLFADHQGNSAVTWLSKLSNKQAITISYKTNGMPWSSLEIISDWGNKIFDWRCFTDANENVYAQWFSRKSKNYFTHIAQKNQNAPWNVTQNWISSIPQFLCYEAQFDSSGNLIFLGEAKTTYTARCTYAGGNYTYQRTLPTIALSTISPDLKETADTFMLEELEEDLLENGTEYWIDPTLITKNQHNVAYAFWETSQHKTTTLMCRKIENHQFCSEPELISQINEYVYSIAASLNENEDIALAYTDREDNLRVLMKTKDSWSEPLLLTKKHTSVEPAPIAMDNACNVLTAYNTKTDGIHCIKVFYIPQGKTDQAKIVFSQPKAFHPTISPDGCGNFIMLWEQKTSYGKGIFGATFSVDQQTWSEPQLLSPKETSCFDYSAAFTEQGKGYISWTSKTDKSKKIIQFAELLH